MQAVGQILAGPDAALAMRILGLGLSHQPIDGALGIEMPSPVSAQRRYVSEVQRWLRGEGPATHLPQRAAAHPVPVHVAALTSQGVELAGELADGIMPFLWSAPRVARSKAWAARGRAKAAGRGPLEITLGLPTFIGNDVEAQRAVARQNLGLYTTLPFFQRLFRAAGFAAEAAKAEQGAGPASLGDRLLDAVCLIGPVGRCREQLGTFALPDWICRSWSRPSASTERERSSRRSAAEEITGQGARTDSGVRQGRRVDHAVGVRRIPQHPD